MENVFSSNIVKLVKSILFHDSSHKLKKTNSHDISNGLHVYKKRFDHTSSRNPVFYRDQTDLTQGVLVKELSDESFNVFCHYSHPAWFEIRFSSCLDTTKTHSKFKDILHITKLNPNKQCCQNPK